MMGAAMLKRHRLVQSLWGWRKCTKIICQIIEPIMLQYNRKWPIDNMCIWLLSWMPKTGICTLIFAIYRIILTTDLIYQL